MSDELARQAFKEILSMDAPIGELIHSVEGVVTGTELERLQKVSGELLWKQGQTLSILRRLFPNLAPEFERQTFGDDTDDD